MSKSDRKGAEYCGRCMKRFSYADWSDPVKANQEHQLTECPKAAQC